MKTTKTEFKFLSLCFEDPSLWAIGFEPVDPVAEELVRQVFRYREKYYKYPNLDTFLEFLRTDCDCSPQEYRYIVRQLKHNPVDEEFAKDKIIAFVESQKIKKAMIEAETLLEANRVAEAKNVLSSSLSFVYNEPHDYFEDELDEGELVSIPTGYACFDEVLKGGGVCRGFLATVMGPQHVGKSLTLVNIGVNSVLQGYDVLHITFQDKKANVVGRYNKAFGKYKKRRGKKGSLKIVQMYSSKNTVADCNSYIINIKPDIVLVDYIDVISYYARTKREGLEKVAQGLQYLALRYDCVVWAAKQTGKHTKYSKREVSGEDSFESYAVAQVSDIILTLSQTKEEKQAKRIRLTLDKNKEGESGITHTFKVDYKKMRLIET